MSIPVIFGCLLIFMAWFYYESKKANRNEKKNQEAFLLRERQANLTRKKDISDLPYLYINMRPFVLPTIEDTELAEQMGYLSSLESQPLLNLSAYSNTELKENYGVANLDYLSKCDSNYAIFIRSITKLSQRLFDLGYSKEAICILEYAVSVSCDSSTIYRLLAAIYKKENMVDKIEELIEHIPSDIYARESLIKFLIKERYS